MTAATLPLSHTDSTAADPAVNFSSARFAFRQLETWLTADEANGASEDQLQQRGRELLRLLLQAHLRQRGTGDVGPALQVYSPPAPAATPDDARGRADGVRHGEIRHHDRTLRTVFGEVRVARTAYATAGQASIHPLDEQLLLPNRSFSYPLQERLVRHAVQGPFDVVEEVKRVDPSGSKTHVALCDGERALQKRILPALQGVVPTVLLILDLMHALEKLWKVAHCLYAEGSEEATAWVKERTLRLLKGEVIQVVKGMRHSATRRGLNGSKRETVDRVAKYLRRNRDYMKYDEYLEKGLPIASGCVEGACKNLIKDRMERSGMRWGLDGGEAMIRLRSLYLSGDLDDYWDFHLAEESRRLYPPGHWEVVEK